LTLQIECSDEQRRKLFRQQMMQYMHMRGKWAMKAEKGRKVTNGDSRLTTRQMVTTAHIVAKAKGGSMDSLPCEEEVEYMDRAFAEMIPEEYR
jgi:hypothetical protein